jgi:hypothetical protein
MSLIQWLKKLEKKKENGLAASPNETLMAQMKNFEDAREF